MGWLGMLACRLSNPFIIPFALSRSAELATKPVEE